ncbi:hypothetical protein Cgig2_015849 [Carnegiea gigantea]|uniref:Uncharacterized protein n=1 Tax=Carnegiea gigantea TaxID=171969 RepID=A0A9Q1GV74_9CARY|nr:hypothetical protein Cgig2_015849 [Carnegiea gigantea]
MLGHTKEVCKKKNVIITEWRMIHKNPNPTQAQPVSIQNLEEQLTIPTCQQVLQAVDTPSGSVIPKPSTSTAQEQPVDFTPVTKGASPKRLSGSAAPTTPIHHNSFNTLIEDRNMWSGPGPHYPVMPSSHGSMAPRAQKQITYAIYAASIYFIWYARNQFIFKNHRITAQHTANMIKEQVRHRILFLNTLSCKYSTQIDNILR